jgi:hypothetical protein
MAIRKILVFKQLLSFQKDKDKFLRTTFLRSMGDHKISTNQQIKILKNKENLNPI